MRLSSHNLLSSCILDPLHLWRIDRGWVGVGWAEEMFCLALLLKFPFALPYPAGDEVSVTSGAEAYNARLLVNEIAVLDERLSQQQQQQQQRDSPKKSPKRRVRRKRGGHAKQVRCARSIQALYMGECGARSFRLQLKRFINRFSQAGREAESTQDPNAHNQPQV